MKEEESLGFHYLDIIFVSKLLMAEQKNNNDNNILLNNNKVENYIKKEQSN